MLKIITTFSGFDSQCLALRYSDIPFELVRWCEFDPESKTPIDKQPAVVAHNLLFPRWADRNLGDVSKVDWQKLAKEVGEIDLLTYSSPCQDVSSAGLQRGIEKGSGTRSSLLWHIEDAVRALQPKYLLQENVSALVSKKFMPAFLDWQHTLEELGYKNYLPPQFVTPSGEKTKLYCMNSKDYGVPQNRQRVFLLSVRNDLGRESYHFPEPILLEKKLKDVLLEEVPEKYFLKQSKVDEFVEKNKEQIDKTTRDDQ